MAENHVVHNLGTMQLQRDGIVVLVRTPLEAAALMGIATKGLMDTHPDVWLIVQPGWCHLMH